MGTHEALHWKAFFMGSRTAIGSKPDFYHSVVFVHRSMWPGCPGSCLAWHQSMVGKKETNCISDAAHIGAVMHFWVSKEFPFLGISFKTWDE
jgi:hypothetical protein